MEENLWKISPNTSKAPNIILEAHAKFLTESTNGLVIGYIKTEQPGFVSSSGKHSIFRLDAHYSQTYLCAITK